MLRRSLESAPALALQVGPNQTGTPTQVPTAYRRRLLVRADRAGATHELLDWLTGSAQVRGRRLEYSVGFPTKNTALTSAITTIPETGVDAGDHLRRRDR